MKLGKPHWVCTFLCLLFLLAAVPAYCQRGSVDINAGQTSDTFGSQPKVTGADLDFNGQVTVIQGGDKNGGPSIVAGGEIRVPTDDKDHAKEFAIYAGPAFRIHNLTIGVNAQVRKLDLPWATVNNQVFVRGNLELLQLPIVIRYTFGNYNRVFVQVQGEPEFSPRFRAPHTLIFLPNPNFDHGYTLRGSAGYTFGKWYVQGTYQTRYLKFVENAGNPSNLYNWKSNMITGGVGLIF